jgi:hypothetical protein
MLFRRHSNDVAIADVLFEFPKVQLTACPLTGPIAAKWGFTVSRVVTLEPKAGRNSRSRVKVSPRFLSLTQRLELLRQHKVRAAIAKTILSRPHDEKLGKE